MARITVEDCLEEIKNRFELVSLAAQRTKAIRYGSPITVDEDNDKKPVIALREISKKNLDIAQLREDLISSLQTRNKVDIIEDENLHAENQENISDDIDLSDEASNIFGNEDNFTLETDSFDDNISEEESNKLI
ncbi:MAG: DNA-directed RNA polymerase subunit omega [Rickettsiaceae bacterium]